MIAPAIQFAGDCAEAMALYKEAFHVTEMFADYYRDAPDDSGLPKTDEMKDRIMHAGMTIFGSLINMNDTDRPDEAVVTGNRYRFNVYTGTADDVKHAYEVLKAGGKVMVELGPQFFSPMYAAVTDRYGVYWQIIGPSEG